MSPLVLIAVAAAAAAAGGGGWVAFRRRRVARAQSAMQRRLAESYPAVDPPAEVLPLRDPSGQIALREEGLAIALGPQTDAFRAVPWSALRQMLPVGGGRVSVHVARVGEVVVPGRLGRALWERSSRLRTS